MRLHAVNLLHPLWTSVSVSTEWQVVFLARPGISSWFGMDWQSGSASTTDSLLCLEDACNTHYRSSLLDSWTSSGIIKVSLIITLVAFINFDDMEFSKYQS